MAIVAVGETREVEWPAIVKVAGATLMLCSIADQRAELIGRLDDAVCAATPALRALGAGGDPLGWGRPRIVQVTGDLRVLEVQAWAITHDLRSSVIGTPVLPVAQALWSLVRIGRLRTADLDRLIGCLPVATAALCAAGEDRLARRLRGAVVELRGQETHARWLRAILADLLAVDVTDAAAA